MPNLIVTIDGPAASGKSTIAKMLSERLGATFLDTGAMYRALTLAAMQQGVDMKDEQKLLKMLDETDFEFIPAKAELKVSINGKDMTEQIRSPVITLNSRHVAASSKVRSRLVEMQRQFCADKEKVVTEGRDQGTVAFPNAQVKFYLTADIMERAKRRKEDIRARGGNESLQQIRDSIASRDKSDQSRTTGPMKPADDAVIVDTTELSIEQVLDKLMSDMGKQKG